MDRLPGPSGCPRELVIEAKLLEPRCAWPTARRLPAGVRSRPLAGRQTTRRRATATSSPFTTSPRKTNRPLAKLTGHRDAIQSIAWSADGKRLATGGFRKVLLWNTADWSPAGEISDLPGRVSAMVFTAANAALATASNAPGQAGEVALWDVADGLAQGLGMAGPRRHRSSTWPSRPTAKRWPPPAPTSWYGFGAWPRANK